MPARSHFGGSLQLKTFLTTGLANSFQESDVIASEIRSVSIRTLDTTSDDGVDFGLTAAESFGKVWVGAPFLRYAAGQALPPAIDDFSLRIV